MNTDCPKWCDMFQCATENHISSTLAELIALSADGPVVLHGKTFPLELEVYLHQHVDEADPRIVIDQLPGRKHVNLLPSEARQLGEALIRFATLADNPSHATFRR